MSIEEIQANIILERGKRIAELEARLAARESDKFYEVAAAVASEREYQDDIWNDETTTSGGEHDVSAWLTFMRSYLREAEDQVSRNPEPEGSELALHTIRKITAMGFACMEQHGAPMREKGNDNG